MDAVFYNNKYTFNLYRRGHIMFVALEITVCPTASQKNDFVVVRHFLAILFNLYSFHHDKFYNKKSLIIFRAIKDAIDRF